MNTCLTGSAAPYPFNKRSVFLRQDAGSSGQHHAIISLSNGRHSTQFLPQSGKAYKSCFQTSSRSFIHKVLTTIYFSAIFPCNKNVSQSLKSLGGQLRTMNIAVVDNVHDLLPWTQCDVTKPLMTKSQNVFNLSFPDDIIITNRHTIIDPHKLRL